MVTPQVIEKSALAKEKRDKVPGLKLSLTIFLLSTNLAVDHAIGVDHIWS